MQERAKQVGSGLDRRIGERIHSARLAFPAMTTALAAKFVGIPEEEFLAFEQGRQRPTADQLVLLADLLNVDPSWFFEK